MSVCFVLCRVYTDDQTELLHQREEDMLLEAEEDENNIAETIIDHDH